MSFSMESSADALGKVNSIGLEVNRKSVVITVLDDDG